MNQGILRVPIQKILTYKPLWVILSLTLFAEFSLIFILSNLSSSAITGSGVSLLKFNFPEIWLNLSWLGKLGNYIIGFLLIFIISADEEHLTLRQHIIDGWSREQAVLSYHVLCLVFATVSILVAVIFSLIFGYSEPNQAIIESNQFRILLCFFLQSFLIFQFALLVSVWVKKSIPALFCFLGWLLIAEPLIGVAIDSNIRKGYSELLPFHTIGKLLPDLNPMGILSGASTVVSINYILISIAYVWLFWLLIWVRIKFRDL